MPPALFKSIVTVMVVTIAVLALAPKKHSAYSPPPYSPNVVTTSRTLSSAESYRAAQKLGYFPAEPSTAVGMTPEWRRFADSVDRICAMSFNRIQTLAEVTGRVGRARGWTRAERGSAVTAVWSKQGPIILRATAKLGTPPKRPDLFRRWRANVAHRAALFHQLSQAAGARRFGEERRINRELERLKQKSDVIGQNFGLRICTSN